MLRLRRGRQQAALQRLRHRPDRRGRGALGLRGAHPVQRLRRRGGQRGEQVGVLGRQVPRPAPRQPQRPDDAVTDPQRPGRRAVVGDDRRPAQRGPESPDGGVALVTAHAQRTVLEQAQDDAVGAQQSRGATAEDPQDVVLGLDRRQRLRDGDQPREPLRLPLLLEVGAPAFGLVRRGGRQRVADGGRGQAQEVAVGRVQGHQLAEARGEHTRATPRRAPRGSAPTPAGPRRCPRRAPAGARGARRGGQRRGTAGQLQVDGRQVQRGRGQHVERLAGQLGGRLQLRGQVAEAGEQLEAPVVLDLAGRLGRDVHDAGDLAVVVADRGVGEREVGLLGVPVAVHDDRHVLEPDGLAGAGLREEGSEVVPRLSEDVPDRTTQRRGVLVADHLHVGLVVEHLQVRAPADDDGEAGLQRQLQRAAQRTGPGVGVPHRRRRPVDVLVRATEVRRGSEGQTGDHVPNLVPI